MVALEVVMGRKKQGGQKPLVGVRMSADEQAHLDRVAAELAARTGGGEPNRADVFRLGIQLVEQGFSLPLVGDLGAGRPRTEPAEDGAVMRVDRLFPREAVVYKVRGDSMGDDHIIDGDYVIVLPCGDPDHGKTVVTWLKDLGGTLKKFDRVKRQIESGKGKGRWVRKLTDEDIIIGYLVGVIRKC